MLLNFHSRKPIINEYDNNINNWLPIDVTLSLGDETYSIDQEVNAKMNLFEIRLMISKIKDIIHCMDNNKKFDQIGISTFDFYFEMYFYDISEHGETECTFWFFEGNRTNGKIKKIDRGFRFIVTVSALRNFIELLEIELNKILIIN